MTAPQPTPVERLKTLEEAVARIQLDLVVNPPPPPAAVPTPQRWADRATTDDWLALVDWVDNLIADYSIRGNDYLPSCWPAHPGVVEELAAVWRGWIAATLADQVAAADGATDLTMWHTYWLAPCLARLKESQYTTTNCRTNKAHTESTITPRLTDSSFLPPPVLP